MIKAICFDLDGVYFDSSGFTRFKNKLVSMGADSDKVDNLLHGPEMEQFKKGFTDEGTYWAKVAQKLGLDLTLEKFKELLVQGYTINNSVRLSVLSAREQGYKTCICSNNFTTRVNGLNDKFNFLGDFDVALFSYDIGELKPSKAMYEELVRRLDVKPNELIYSDDNESKLAGAKELGVHAFIYSTHKDFLGELSALGVRL